jgi:hypothetical protein
MRGVWGSHSRGYEGFYLLGFNAVRCVKSQLMFGRNMSPPSSGWKNKPSSFINVPVLAKLRWTEGKGVGKWRRWRVRKWTSLRAEDTLSRVPLRTVGILTSALWGLQEDRSGRAARKASSVASVNFNNIKKFNSYFTENMHNIHYKHQSVNAPCRNDHRLLWESYKT